jgi:hypothetical protein
MDVPVRPPFDDGDTRVSLVRMPTTHPQRPFQCEGATPCERVSKRAGRPRAETQQGGMSLGANLTNFPHVNVRAL